MLKQTKTFSENKTKNKTKKYFKITNKHSYIY